VSPKPTGPPLPPRLSHAAAAMAGHLSVRQPKLAEFTSFAYL